MGLILLILVILLIVAALPTWGYSSWGYGPVGALGFVAVIVLVLMFAGYLPRGF